MFEINSKEIPLLREFKTQLDTDAIFRDHFNAFLQLPVFPQRFLYDKEKGIFELLPNLQSALLEVDDHKVLEWVYFNRYPYFWNSELYYAFHLSSALGKRVESFFGTTNGLQSFLQFLSGTQGEAAYLYWMRVEKLKHVCNRISQRELVRQINRLHLCATSPFKLSDDLLDEILFDVPGAPSMNQEINIFIKAQGHALDALCSYWCREYKTDTHNDELITKSDYGDAALVDVEMEPSSRLDSMSPEITDRGEEGYERRADNLPPLMSISLASGTPNPTAVSGSLMPLVSKSIQKFFQTSTDPATRSGSNSQLTSNIENDMEKKVHLHQQFAYLQASLRTNHLAGGPLNHYIEFGRYQTTTATSSLFFWTSVESILTKDEMRRWQNRQVTVGKNVKYTSLFYSYPMADNIQSLLELHLLQKSPFLVRLPPSMLDDLRDLLPKGLGEDILLSAQDHVIKLLFKVWIDFVVYDHKFFTDSCTRRKQLTRLPSEIQRELSEDYHITETVDMLLWAKYTHAGAQAQYNMWKAAKYAEMITNPGLCRLPSRMVFQPKPQLELPPPGRRSCSPNDIDRTATSTPDDWLNIEYKGISLTPMVTTVLRTSKWTPTKWTQRILTVIRPAGSDTWDETLPKPPIPDSFTELLRNSLQLRGFYQYLISKGNGAEVPLVFWLAVEDMKDTLHHDDEKQQAVKIRRIKRRFFTDAAAELTVHCKDTRVHELSATLKPTAFQVFDAQEAIAKTLKARWYNDYVDFLKGEAARHYSEEEIDVTFSETEIKQVKKPKVKVQTKGLWTMFTRSVVSFRHGLMDPSTLSLYKMYLRSEILQVDGTSGNKRVIGKKTINITKVLNDLSFWAEVERYKDMADVINAAKASGTFTPEDSIMLHKKANAIVNCYIDSSVPPRTQVNVPSEIVGQILDNLSMGIVSRGLFHEAALHIFSVLVLYWKKFCIWRWAPKKKKQAPKPTRRSSHTRTLHVVKRTTSVRSIMKVDSQYQFLSELKMMFHYGTTVGHRLNGSVISFSLRTGIQVFRQYSIPNTYSSTELPIQPQQSQIATKTSKLMYTSTESVHATTSISSQEQAVPDEQQATDSS